MSVERQIEMPIGVVVRRSPGVTRWAKYAWTVIGVLPGASKPGRWTELRRDGEVIDYHAGTVTLTLYRADTEAYMVALNGNPPSVWAVLRQVDDPGPAEAGMEVQAVTASAYEAQDYMDNGEDMVEMIPMSQGLMAWVGEFCERHHVDEQFIKRRRGAKFEDKSEDGIGDARVRQAADVYRSPASIRKTEEET